MDTIYNPLTGSHVKINGAVAKKLVKACANKEVVLLPEDVKKLADQAVFQEVLLEQRSGYRFLSDLV